MDQEMLIHRSKNQGVQEVYSLFFEFTRDSLKRTVDDKERDVFISSFLSIEDVILSSLSSVMQSSTDRRFSSLIDPENRSRVDKSREFEGTDFSSVLYVSQEFDFFYKGDTEFVTLDDIFDTFECLLEENTDDVIRFLTSVDMSKISSFLLPPLESDLLHLTCSRGHIEIAHFMVERGFPSGSLCLLGKSPLHYFLEEGICRRRELHPNEDEGSWAPFFKSLLASLDPSYRLPALKDARENRFLPANRMSRVKRVNMDMSHPILSESEYPASLQNKGVSGDSLLHCAVKANCPTLVTVLTSLGADVRAINGNKLSVLEAIVSGEDARSTEMLRCVFGVMDKKDIVPLGPSLLRCGTHILFSLSLFLSFSFLFPASFHRFSPSLPPFSLPLPTLPTYPFILPFLPLPFISHPFSCEARPHKSVFGCHERSLLCIGDCVLCAGWI